jgi:hypothetical protein
MGEVASGGLDLLGSTLFHHSLRQWSGRVATGRRSVKSVFLARHHRRHPNRAEESRGSSPRRGQPQVVAPRQQKAQIRCRLPLCHWRRGQAMRRKGRQCQMLRAHTKERVTRGTKFRKSSPQRSKRSCHRCPRSLKLCTQMRPQCLRSLRYHCHKPTSMCSPDLTAYSMARTWNVMFSHWTNEISFVRVPRTDVAGRANEPVDIECEPTPPFLFDYHVTPRQRIASFPSGLSALRALYPLLNLPLLSPFSRQGGPHTQW